MSKWITDRRPTIDDADCTGFVWITTDYGGVLREQWKTVRDRPWMPITIPEPYVEPPKRYKLVKRSTTGQYYIQDTESCDKRFVASCIPTREKAARISNIFEEQNSMSEWITDRKPTLDDAMQKIVFAWIDGKCTLAFWDYVSSANLPWQPISTPEPYVKPKRFRVVLSNFTCYERYELWDESDRRVAQNISTLYEIWDESDRRVAQNISTFDDALHIAKIYEEMKP